jgi:hydrogenase nickel incorporation protein HypA/HybF
MHELSIATALVEQLQRIAAEQRAARITEVEVRCGVLRQVVPDALQLAFEAASAETLVAGAVLKVVEEGLRARCRTCRQEFAAAIDDYLCPRCRTADVELLAGQDVVLQSVTYEIEDRNVAS